MSLADRVSLPKPVIMLHDELEALPALDAAHALSQGLCMIQKLAKSGVLEVLCEMLGLTDSVASEEVREESRKGGKKRKRDQVAVKSLTRQNSSSNPFEVLGIE
jgi:hypothetical protein